MAENGHNRIKRREAELEKIEGVVQLRGESAARVIRGFQPAPTDLGTMTGNVTLTIAQVMTGVVHGDPDGSGRTLTLPTNALLQAGLDDPQAGDCIDFYVINEATAGADEPMEVAAGTGGSLVGEGTVEAAAVSGEESSGSGHFRIRIASSSAYVCYRLA